MNAIAKSWHMVILWCYFSWKWNFWKHLTLFNKFAPYDDCFRDKDKTLNRSEKSVNGLSHRVSRQRVKNNELKKLTENYHAPTIDGYFDIKVSQHEGLKKQQERERKKELVKLIKKNQKAREKRNRRVAKKPAKKIRIPSPSSKDQIYRGPTFDIVYTVPA